MIRVNHGYSLCVFFYNHVCPIFTIYPLRSWEDKWACVQVRVGACVCVWWGYHLFIISHIYTFNLKIMIRLNQTFFHLSYLTLRHPNWDKLAILEILLSDKSRCRSLWLLVKPSMTLKKPALTDISPYKQCRYQGPIY